MAINKVMQIKSSSHNTGEPTEVQIEHPSGERR